jgi:predicted ATPase/DNA-binding winged helix-turn-helix (wHTH) protein
MIQIGQLNVLLEHREIRMNGQPVRLGSRAYDIFELVVRADGAVVSKDEIMRHVWPDTVVEENNLQVHVSALRRALGNDRECIHTVPGRGYRLIRTATAASRAANDPAHEVDAMASGASLVVQQGPQVGTSALIGRQDTVVELVQAVSSSRIVTLVGTGGIGKTRLAVEVGRTLLGDFPEGVVFVPFAPVSEAQSAFDAVAIALGSKLSTGRVVLEQIATEWKNRRALIVLDNCEQVVNTAAEIAEVLVGASSEIRVLATSREALRARDEAIYVVPPLAVPMQDEGSCEMLQASAVQLLLARARAVDPRFSADEESVRLMGEVCRRLDGIPLALELAAARAALLGIGLLAANLDDRFRILTGGRRTALPRHQTLKATLDWSYRLLDSAERKVLRWLGVFVNGFTFDAACYMVECAGLNPMQAIDAVSGLVSKSLLTREPDGAACRYRLLETTRAYALQQLDDNGERGAAACAHATFFRNLFDRAQKRWTARPIEDWLGEFRRELGNLRAALDWAQSAHGDATIGVELAAVTVPYLFDLSLVKECCNRARDALRLIERDNESLPVSLETRLRLQSALAAGLVYTDGPLASTRDVWQAVLARAIEAGHSEYESRALWGLWNWYQYGGEVDKALSLARRFGEQARKSGNITHGVLNGRIEGIALHYAGAQQAARERLEWMIQEYRQPEHRWNAIGFRIEHSVVAHATLSRVLWVQGHHDEALRLAAQTFDAALRYDHEMMTCYVLVEAMVPIALFTGEYATAERSLIVLRQLSSRSGFAIWVACCECYEAYLQSVSRRDLSTFEAFRRALDRLRQTGFLAPLSALLCQFALALMEGGRVDDALATIDEALQHCDDTGDGWYYAELCRVKGEILRAVGKLDEAQHWFAAALAYAREDGANTFELRAATNC